MIAFGEIVEEEDVTYFVAIVWKNWGKLIILHRNEPHGYEMLSGYAL
jgi:hypothetical protein